MGKDENGFNQHPIHAIPRGKEQKLVKELLVESGLHPIAKEKLANKAPNPRPP